MFRRLYDWVLHWANTTHGVAALFALSFAEASFFPIPPDVLLSALVLSVPKKWLRFWAICTVASVLGGIAGYFIGFGVWEAVSPFFFKYVFPQSAFEAVQRAYQHNDFLAVFAAGFTPIPYKVFTIAGGVCRINFAHFMAASILSRGARFFIVALLIGIFGERIKLFIDKYFNLLTIVFVVVLVGGFIAIKYIWR